MTITLRRAVMLASMVTVSEFDLDATNPFWVNYWSEVQYAPAFIMEITPGFDVVYD